MLHVVRELSRVGGAFALLAGVLLTNPARAATIAVTTTDDELDADGDCSLREAIRAANLDVPVDACPAGAGADEVVVPAGTYTLAIAGIAEDGGLTGDLDVTADLTITGAGAGTTIIDGGGLDRVFHVDPRGDRIAVTLRGVTIQNGRGVGVSFVRADGAGVLLGSTAFRTHVDLRPAQNLLVRIEASFDKATGLATWRSRRSIPTPSRRPRIPLPASSRRTAARRRAKAT